MKKFLTVLFIVILFGLVAFFMKGQKPEGTEQGMSSRPPTPVSVMTLHSETVDLFETLPGRVVAFEVAEIRPQVTGIITERLFTEGNRVNQGDQLYQIDPAPYQATHQRATADLAKAEANVKSIQARTRRYQELVQIDAVSRQEYDDISASLAQAKADVDIAEAALGSAQIDLDYTKVFAPITGRISKSLFTKGALVTANQPQQLARITQLNPIYVDVVQSSEEMSRMRQSLGAKDKLEVELFLENKTHAYSHPGEMQFAEVTVDQGTGSVQLRALFPNPDEFLLPGMFVRMRMKVESREGILVPQRAAIRGPDGSLSVWVVHSDNKVEKRIIQSDKAFEDNWLTTEGLKDGETIVIEGIQKIGPGAIVDPTEESDKEQK